LETRRLIEGTCPECRGPLSEVAQDGIVEFACLVGHRYSPTALLKTHYETEERTLWAAVLCLEEVEKLVQAVAPHLQPEAAKNLQADAEEKRQQADQIRRTLDGLRAYRLGSE